MPALFAELLRVELPVEEVLRPAVLLPEAFFATPPFRAPVELVLLLLVEPVFLAPLLELLFMPALVPLSRAEVLVPLVLVPLLLALDLRAPELGAADLRAAVFRRGDALAEEDADLAEDLEDERFVALLGVPVREPALRLELLGDDFLAAML
ncbi:MAG: hypothetical protein ACR2KM_01615 [Gemmatimonadaceae bacterium]